MCNAYQVYTKPGQPPSHQESTEHPPPTIGVFCFPPVLSIVTVYMATTQNAYRQMAQRVHPDSDGGNADRDKFEAVTAAYDVLSDPGKRSTYDQVYWRVFYGVILACLWGVCGRTCGMFFGREFWGEGLEGLVEGAPSGRLLSPWNWFRATTPGPR